MNIFILDENPKLSAQYMCEDHLNCMPKEALQLMSTAQLLYGGIAPYKLTHKNHPCNVWTRTSSSNWQWLKNYALEMCLEFEYRRGKPHKCKELLSKFGPCKIPEGPLTPFALCMPDEFKTPDPVQSYRNFYLGPKARFATWIGREKPYWWNYGNKNT